MFNVNGFVKENQKFAKRFKQVLNVFVTMILNFIKLTNLVNFIKLKDLLLNFNKQKTIFVHEMVLFNLGSHDSSFFLFFFPLFQRERNMVFDLLFFF